MASINPFFLAFLFFLFSLFCSFPFPPRNQRDREGTGETIIHSMFPNVPHFFLVPCFHVCVVTRLRRKFHPKIGIINVPHARKLPFNLPTVRSAKKKKSGDLSSIIPCLLSSMPSQVGQPDKQLLANCLTARCWKDGMRFQALSYI